MPAGARQLRPDRGSCGKAGISIIDPEDLQRGRKLALRYRLLRPLGRRGSVWLATDDNLQQVVLKTGPADRVEQEYRVASALIHPNIVRVLGYVDSEVGPIIAFEYLPGGDLVSLAGLDPAHWLPALRDVTAGLAYLHGQGLVHRDLKARNVMFDAGGTARLIDFGSAAPVGSRWTVGGTTAEAISPDRGAGPVAFADDIYALAALSHELIHGAPPQAGRRREPTTDVAPLARLADTCLATPKGQAATLGRFATVIESQLDQLRV